MLCYRAARWLAPEYFANRLQSLLEIRIRIGVLRERINCLSAKRRNGWEGRILLGELQSLEGIFKSTSEYADRYELLKIEVEAGEAKELSKRKLFQGVAAALAQSAEIEKFMYFREYGETRVAGIHLYLRHENPKRR